MVSGAITKVTDRLDATVFLPVNRISWERLPNVYGGKTYKFGQNRPKLAE